MRHILLLFVTLPLSACGGGNTPHAAPPSHAELIAHETELLRLTLTPEARQRLGIETVRIRQGSASTVRQAAGEMVVPPSVAGGVPVGSLSNLQQIGSQQAVADGDVARTTAQARLARIAVMRADALVREQAGSVRARDEAAAALAAAEAALGAAREQRRLLGPDVAGLSNQSILWVRVSVFGGDVDLLDRSAAVSVYSLGAGKAPRAGRPVRAVPSANATAGTVDLYYAVPNGDRRFQLGQRVAVDLPISGARTPGITVPSAAILRDIYGGEWVYKHVSKNDYVRQRIEVASEAKGQALLARGLAQGDQIVTNGAAELFGTEFGAAH